MNEKMIIEDHQVKEANELISELRRDMKNRRYVVAKTKINRLGDIFLNLKKEPKGAVQAGKDMVDDAMKKGRRLI